MIRKIDGSKGARFVSVFCTALAAVLLGQALLFLLPRYVPYGKVRALLQWYEVAHGVPAGAGSYWIEEHYRLFVGRLSTGASILGICGITLMWFKRRLVRFLVEIPSEWKYVRSSFRDWFHPGPETGVEIAAISVVFSVGIFLRVWHLKRGVRFDEAWTYLDFASKPLFVGLSNYTAPNNHLLNTLLIHFSTRLFGNTLFGLRFPALVAGCVVILASWLTARALYGRLAGILTAGCTAALPTFIEFSINGRGYALQWLSVLALALLGAALLENPSLKLGWLVFVLAATLGVYSIPTTLIALAGVFTWMFVSALTERDGAKLKGMSEKMVLAGLGIAVLSALLYLPPLLVRGPGALLAKDMVAQQQADFPEGLKRLGQCTWVRWTEGVPPGILWVLFLGLAISLLFYRKVWEKQGSGSGNAVFLTIALWVTAVVFGWARHVFGFPRVWSYLLLCSVMAACGGLALVVRSLVGRSRLRQVVFAGGVSTALTVIVGVAILKQRVLFTTNETVTVLDGDQIADFLTTALRPSDGLVSNAVVNYELLRRAPRLYASLGDPKQAARVVAVVHKSLGTKTEVCRAEEFMALLATAQDTADPAVLSNQIDLNVYAPPQVLAKFLTSTVYSLERRQNEERLPTGLDSGE